MSNATEQFYDRFSSQFIRDYVFGNRRVERQVEFLKAALPATARRVLVIGCGTGQSAHGIASRFRDVTVLAVDLGAEIIKLARALYPHPRVTYRKLDILRDELEGVWDAIVLPDVYEHIPLDQRPVLHARLDRLLDRHGRLLLTIPSAAKQRSLHERGEGLQIVDEIVTMDDLMKLAADVHGELTYLSFLSVWQPGDYVHVVIARGAPRLESARRRAPGLDDVVRLLRAPYRYARLRVRLWRSRDDA